MRLLALLLLLINLLAFAYWHLLAPPPAPKPVYISAHLPKGVEKLRLLSEVKKAEDEIVVADAGALLPPHKTDDEIAHGSETETASANIANPAADTAATELNTEEAENASTVVDHRTAENPDNIAAEVPDIPIISAPTDAPLAALPDTPLAVPVDIARAEPPAEFVATLPENFANTVSPNETAETSETSETAENAGGDMTAQVPPSPLPTTSGRHLSEAVVRDFARLADARLTEADDAAADTKSLLSANSSSNRLFLSGSAPDAAADLDAAVPVSALPPMSQFQPVRQGSHILQLPPTLAEATANTPSTTAAPAQQADTQPAAEAPKTAARLSQATPATSSVALNNSEKTATKTVLNTTTNKNKVSEPTVCFRTGIFKQAASAEQARTWLQKNHLTVHLRSDVKKEKVATWLYLPPFRSQALARQAEQELARRGVQDYYLVTQTPWNNAISLGLFTQDSSVTRRLAELKRKGYYNVRVQHRYQDDSRYWLDLSLRESQHTVLRNFAEHFKVLMPQKISCK